MMNFTEIQEQARQEWESLQNGSTPLIAVGTATCGRSAGALTVVEAFKKELASRPSKVENTNEDFSYFFKNQFNQRNFEHSYGY